MISSLQYSRISPFEHEESVNKTSIFLSITNPSDYERYRIWLGKQFNLSSLILVLVVQSVFFVVNFNEGFDEEDNEFQICSIIFFSISLILLFTYILFMLRVQLIYYIQKKDLFDKSLKSTSSFYIEDLILISMTLARSFSLLSNVGRSHCSSKGAAVVLVGCTSTDESSISALFMTVISFISILSYSIFLKSIYISTTFISWGIFSVTVMYICIFVLHRTIPFSVIVCIIFFILLYETCRFRLNSFFLGLQANKAESLIKKERLYNSIYESLLKELLPELVFKQMINGLEVIPENYNDVTIFFSDIVGFTDICSKLEPIDVFHLLNQLYTIMDSISQKFNLYKVETIGDAYMVVGGLPEKMPGHAAIVCNFALAVQQAVKLLKSPTTGKPLEIRIGIHTGSVIAGVVGQKMPRYCLFGDTVNTTSRMESTCLAGKIQCSQETYKSVMENLNEYSSSVGYKWNLNFTPRKNVEIKGKGIMNTYWLSCDEVDLPEIEQVTNDIIFFPKPELLFEGSKSSLTKLTIEIPSKDSEERNYSKSIVLSPTINQKIRVLIVEDSKVQLNMLKYQLQKTSKIFEIFTATSFEDALPYLRGQLRPTILIIDDDLNSFFRGGDLIKLIRARENEQDLHFNSRMLVISCSSNPSVDKTGADYYWTKPLNNELLKNQIKEIIKLRFPSHLSSFN